MVIKTSQSPESQKLNRNVYSLLDGLRDFKSAFNILILQAISVVTVVVLYHAISYNVSTSLMLHIVFCVTGFAFLMTSSILLFAGNNFFGRPMNRYHKSLIHGFFIGMGTVLTITGISIEIDARGSEWPHFSSTHGITGLVAMILMIIASCGGILATQVQRINRIIPIRPIWWKVFHNSIGLSAYIIGMISICYATQTWWGLMYFTYEIRVAIIVVIGVTVFWTSISAFLTLTDYFKSLFSH